MKPEHEARRKIIREWMSLPKDKRSHAPDGIVAPSGASAISHDRRRYAFGHVICETLMHYKLGHHPMGGKFFRNHINFHHTYYSKRRWQQRPDVRSRWSGGGSSIVLLRSPPEP